MEEVGNIDGSPLGNYKIGNKIIGRGSFGEVKIAVHIPTEREVAIKILNREKMEALSMEEEVRREIKIGRLLMHPHVIRLYEAIETHTNIYVVMEHAKGGELYDYVVTNGELQEQEARRIFQQIISGVEYCHRNMVVHRDLKPENFLLDAEGNVKLVDFGSSDIMRDGHFLGKTRGSLNYAAPEVVSGKLYAGPEVDIWSCGVILYVLLCGSLPFDDDVNITNIYKKIKSGVYRRLPSHLSSEACDIITRMLIVDPLKRISTSEICQHPWFRTHLPRYLAVTPPNVVEYLKQLDEEIIQKVIAKGFDRNQLIESLHKRIQNNATVTYYLLLDSKSPMVSGYLGAEFEESKEDLSAEPYPEMNGFPVGAPQLSREKQWLVGFQSSAHPREIMKHVLTTLQGLNVRWKKIGDYNMKCLYVHGVHVLKFEIQLYKTSDAAHYVVDLQRLSGPVFLFLDFCSCFMIKPGVA